MALEESGEEDEEVEVVGDEEEGKWRTWVMAGNEKGLNLEYKKQERYDFFEN